MFKQIVGNERAKDVLRRMLHHDRIPGAMLFAGEAGVGKRLFTIELAKALNCRAPKDFEACDECSSCRRIARASGQQLSEDEDAILWSEHGDIGFIRTDKRNIRVGVIRQLERESNFRPVEGKRRVFIIEDADKLNDASSNALLKTLEEVAPTTHIILITAHPASLLPTILSRCQTIRFAPLASDEIEKFLIDSKKRSPQEAQLVAGLARGRLGAALEMNLDEYRARREAMLTILDALVGSVRGGKLSPDIAKLLRAAEDLTDTKRKDDYEPRLEILETLIHDTWLLSLDAKAGALVNEDLRARLAKIASAVNNPARFAAWLARIESLRARLAVNLNRKIATDALLLEMAAA